VYLLGFYHVRESLLLLNPIELDLKEKRKSFGRFVVGVPARLNFERSSFSSVAVLGPAT
jgi:hypothetical protein